MISLVYAMYSFLFKDRATPVLYTLSLHDALPIFRSYYPSECHADYFDFERIEALKPAIEACGISTLSQSPMLGFHKQMDNRIKLLEEILSFRMQGVEFDNGDMYVDGHKAASRSEERRVGKECRCWGWVCDDKCVRRAEVIHGCRSGGDR